MADLLTQFGFTSSLFDAIKEVKTSGNVVEEKKVDPKLTALHKRAQDTSKEHGVVKHINKNDHDNGHHVSDFYDDDKTVATYNKGKLKEEVEKKPSTVNMSHQGKTTLNHIKNPTVQQRMLAHDIKPGIKGYRDRIALLRTGKESGNLKEDELEELDEISTKTLAKAAKSASDPDSDYSYGKSHDPQKFADHAKKTKDAKSAAAVQGAADAKGHYPRDNHTQGYDKLAHRTPSRVTASGKANKQDTKALKTKLKEEGIEESFSPAQIATLKAEYSKINGIDPSQPTYKKLIAMLDKLDLASLKSLAGADIKFVSMLAKNRVTRKSVKEEVEKLDETHVAINSKTGKVDFVGDKKSRDEFIKSKNGLHQPGQTTGNQRKVGDKWMREEVEKKPSTVNMSHQGKTTLNHIKNPTVQQRMAAHDIKPGIKGYRDRIDLLRDAEHKKNLKKEEVEELDELSKDTLKSYAKKAVGDLHKQGVKQNDQKATARYKGLHKAVDKLSEEDVEEELKGDQHKLDKNKNGKLDAEDFKKVRKSVAEGIMDKIKAVKRGMEAKAKAADHFDKASEPSNPNKSKDLKRAVKYHNLVNKEETEIEEENSDQKTTHHNDYSSVSQAVKKHAEKHGFEVDHDHWMDKHRTKASIKTGKTKAYDDPESKPGNYVKLKKDGKSTNSKIKFQVHKKLKPGGDPHDSRDHRYELSNMHVEEFQLDEEVKVGDKVSFDHPMKAIPGKTMKKVGTVHKVEDDTVHIKVKDKYGVITHKKSASELTKEEFESIDEASDYETHHNDYDSVVKAIKKHAAKHGLEVDHDHLIDKHSSKASRRTGKTIPYNDPESKPGNYVKLKKDGKSTNSKLKYQVHSKVKPGGDVNDSRDRRYELSNMHVEEFEYIDEAPKYDNKYTIYHKDYSSAVQHAAVHAGKQGYEIDHEDWDRVVAMGPKKPSAGKTNILNVSLKKNGVETKKKLHMQVYNMDNKGYELNTYVEEVGGYDEFKSGGKPLEKKFNKAFKAMGIKSDVKIKTVGNISVNEAAKPTKRFKDMKKKNTAGTKSEEGDSKKGEPLSGKKEPIEVNPELHKNQK